MDSSSDDLIRTLAAARDGDPDAVSRLMDLVYEPLRALAGRALRRQPAGHTLQPTALVHEVFLRVAGRDGLAGQGRSHFFAVCATAMRGILVDHARRKGAAKRGGDRRRVTLDDAVSDGGRGALDLLDLEEELARLAELEPRHARVAECRIFAGMTIPEIAEALGVSPRTVDDDWATARAWLRARLSANGSS